MSNNSDFSSINIEFTVDTNYLIAGVSKVISLVKSHWEADKIEYKVFSNGITNKLVGATYNEGCCETILVRVYGENTEKIIDRDTEIKNLEILQTLGYGPRLYAQFTNGLAYQFLPGCVLEVDTCRTEHIYPLVAEKMALFHQLLPNIFSNSTKDMNCLDSIKPILWNKIRSFLSLLPERFEDVLKQERYKNEVAPTEDLIRELNWMEFEFDQLQSPIVFCHNDLLLANIIYNKDNHSINFIDFEYAGPNYQAFDIANHFCEFAGVDDVDLTRYPEEDFRRIWITCYLKTFHQCQEIDAEEVEVLLERVEKFSLASHFFWAVWAIIQAAHSTIEFDFLGYSIARMEEYYRKKMVIFGGES